MKGDVVEVDIESEAGGAPIPGGKISGDSFVLGESRFIPGFDEHIVGHQEGEVLRFSVAAPGDYWESSLRGKKVDFTVTVRAVFERKLPELTDDFAKSLGSAFVSLEALRKNVESGLSLEKAERERERLRAKVLEAMVVGTKVEVPDIMIERTLDGLVHEAKARGGAVAGDDAKLRESLRDRARERVLANLVLHRLVEAEGLEPTREEIEAEAERLKLDPEKHYDYSYGAVRHRKVFEFLESQAKQA
jgi:trigger factor